MLNISTLSPTDTTTPATREEMSAARLPLAYRDSCTNLLIPLNRCRFEEYYLPWKCEVCREHSRWSLAREGKIGR